MGNTYTLKDSDLIFNVSDIGIGKKYVLKIRDLPEDKKPREKLLKNGASSLKTNELLAVLFGVGTKKEEVLAMASRIIKEYGEKSLANQKDAMSMSKNLDIPITKAIQVVACAELGRRFFQKNTASIALIRTPKDVFNFTKDMRELPKEQLRGIYLNAHYRVIHDEVISIGTVNSNIVHPREVFKPALAYSAVAVVLAHNHPSGSTKPSLADKEITEQLIIAGKTLGIDLIDHVIVTKNKFASISANYNK